MTDHPLFLFSRSVRSPLLFRMHYNQFSCLETKKNKVVEAFLDNSFFVFIFVVPLPLAHFSFLSSCSCSPSFLFFSFLLFFFSSSSFSLSLQPSFLFLLLNILSSLFVHSHSPSLPPLPLHSITSISYIPSRSSFFYTAATYSLFFHFCCICAYSFPYFTPVTSIPLCVLRALHSYPAETLTLYIISLSFLFTPSHLAYSTFLFFFLATLCSSFFISHLPLCLPLRLPLCLVSSDPCLLL